MARAAGRRSTVDVRPARDERRLLDALRQGDERAFVGLVEDWSGAMLRMARARLESHAVAEEVVQEAWLTVLRDLDRFEGRSALRTWVLGIVVNLARSRARSERRSTPLPTDNVEPVSGKRFRPADDPRWPGHWALPPSPWPTPDDEVLAAETRRVVLGAVEALPPAQREVLVLRDLEGYSAEEACNILGLTDTNQRVLLHRARSRVRGAIERYYEAAEVT